MEKKKLFTEIEDGKDPVVTAGDDILYLILIEATPKYDDGENYRTWEFKKGRQAAYDYIKDMLVNEGDEDVDVIVDIDKSIIYAENPNIKDSKLKLSNGISLYKFMKDISILHKVEVDDSFCIDDYHQENIDDVDSDTEE